MRADSQSDSNSVLKRKTTEASLLVPHLQKEGHLKTQQEDRYLQAKQKTLTII